MNDEGCEYLRDYLEWRMKHGETLTPTSPIIPAEKGAKQRKIGSHITTAHASDTIKAVVLKAGYTDRAYLLRRYFASQLQDAEEDQLSTKDNRIFWMGHSGTIEEEYTQNKGRLPQKKVEKQREAYKRASERYLTTKEPKLIPADKIRAEVVRVFFKGAKLRDDSIAEIRDRYGGLEKVPDDDIPKLVDEYQQKGHQGTYASLIAENGKENGKQIIVAATDAGRYLNDGYTYVATLPNNEIILQQPN
jgi:hypothetical protein